MSKRRKKINSCLSLLDLSYKAVQGAVRFNRGYNFEHEFAKTVVAWALMQDGKDVYTEVIFEGGGRADVLVPEDYRVYEILHSEELSSAEEKLDYYPEEVDIVFLTTEEVFNEWITEEMKEMITSLVA